MKPERTMPKRVLSKEQMEEAAQVRQGVVGRRKEAAASI